MLRKSMLLMVFVFATATTALGQNPEIQPFFPAGVGLGKPSEILIKGTNLQEANGILASFPGKFTLKSDKKTEATELKVLIEPGPNLVPGFQTIRVCTSRGISNPRVIALDALPEVTDVGNNTTRALAMEIKPPCVVNGKIDAEIARWYKIDAKKGQYLSMETLGHRLGSALDPQIVLYDPKGREVQGGYSNDSPGLLTDARVRYEFKENGIHFVSIRDVSWRGGADFIFRLRVGNFPMATTPFPLAIQAGKETLVSFAGPATEGTIPVLVNAAKATAGTVLTVIPKFSNGGEIGMPVELQVSNTKEFVESNNNNTPANALSLSVPCGISGRFGKRGERDYYKFACKKGQRLILDGTSAGRFTPTELYLEVLDSKGAKILKGNPAASPVLDFSAPADGEFTLSVEHLHLWGGPTESYRVEISAPQPEIILSLQTDRYTVNQAGEVSIPVMVQKKNFDGPFKIITKSPAGFQGSLSVEKGKPAKPTDPVGNMVLKAPANQPIGPVEIQFGVEGPTPSKFEVEKPISTALAGLPVLPSHFYAKAAMAVLEKPPFVVQATLSEKTTKIGQKVNIKAKVVRDKGFEGAINLSLDGLPKEVTATTATIPGGMTEATLTITIGAKAEVGKPALKLIGKSTKGAREFVVLSDPSDLQISK